MYDAGARFTDGVVKIWDLRSLRGPVFSIHSSGSKTLKSKPIIEMEWCPTTSGLLVTDVHTAQHCCEALILRCFTHVDLSCFMCVCHLCHAQSTISKDEDCLRLWDLSGAIPSIEAFEQVLRACSTAISFHHHGLFW